MQDLKAVLITVLTQGLKDFGYGVRAVQTVQPSNPDQPIITLKRSGSQAEDDRPLITVRRIGGLRSTGFYLGNAATPMSGVDSPNVPLIMADDRIRIGIEAFQDTGGQSLVDTLMLQIPVMLLQNWDAMTFPIEVGGYGLFNLSFQGSGDTVRTNEAGGKIVYTNSIDVTATLPVDTSSTVQPLGTISAIAIDPTLPNVDPSNPNFSPNP